MNLKLERNKNSLGRNNARKCILKTPPKTNCSSTIFCCKGLEYPR